MARKSVLDRAIRSFDVGASRSDFRYGEKGGSYPGTGEGEISPPSPSGEVVEAYEVAGLPESWNCDDGSPWRGPKEPTKEVTYKPSPWRPDNVRRARKLKAQLEWAAKKKKIAKKRKSRQKRLNCIWNYYHRTLGSDPWKKYTLIWKKRGYELRITKEEFLDLIDACGGIAECAFFRVWDGVVSVDNLLVCNEKKEVLHRGPKVPNDLRPEGRYTGSAQKTEVSTSGS